MKFMDALTSGLRFRRPGLDWQNHIKTLTSRTAFYFQDIMADDWEIESPTVTITKSEFWNACARLLKQDYNYGFMSYTGPIPPITRHAPAAINDLEKLADILFGKDK